MKNRINMKSKNPALNEDLSFLLWKAELNKELYSFWKSIMDD